MRVANPLGSGVPPIPTLDTSVLLLTFLPADAIFGTRVRVVKGFPLGLIVGAAFIRQHYSALLFEGAGWFKPAPAFPRVSLLPWRAYYGGLPSHFKHGERGRAASINAGGFGMPRGEQQRLAACQGVHATNEVTWWNLHSSQLLSPTVAQLRCIARWNSKQRNRKQVSRAHLSRRSTSL